ncbi:hypothetical protein [Streptomyces sp. NPDC048269]|uniref:hypothetical protein n=1 Tax=Streptomyces sp. NPDC048269 TaxID=3155753 RepID=UPI00344094D3
MNDRLSDPGGRPPRRRSRWPGCSRRGDDIAPIPGTKRTDRQMAQIADLDTGTTLFFDHHDPEMVAWLSKRRLDG